MTRMPQPAERDPAVPRTSAELAVLLDLDRRSGYPPGGIVGTHPPRARQRWRLLGVSRLGRLSDRLDPAGLQKACVLPWAEWARTDPAQMLASVRTDSVGCPGPARIGAYELARHWWGAGLTLLPEGGDLMADAVRLLLLSGVHPASLLLHELAAVPGAGVRVRGHHDPVPRTAAEVEHVPTPSSREGDRSK